MSQHHLSHASELFYGDARLPIHPLTKVALGSPATLDADGLIVAATSTELPNATTKTYTTATDNTTPLDGAIAAPSTVFLNGANVLVWALAVPRNITGLVAHATTSIAMTVTVNGYDVYGKPLAELLTFGASGSDVAVAGKKAFKYIYSYVITSTGDATANTLDLGWGDVLGLPYVLTAAADVMQVLFNGVSEAATLVVADTATATATTGDVRGTLDTTSASDGSAVVVWASFNPSGFGATQFGG